MYVSLLRIRNEIYYCSPVFGRMPHAKYLIHPFLSPAPRKFNFICLKLHIIFFVLETITDAPRFSTLYTPHKVSQFEENSISVFGLRPTVLSL